MIAASTRCRQRRRPRLAATVLPQALWIVAAAALAAPPVAANDRSAADADDAIIDLGPSPAADPEANAAIARGAIAALRDSGAEGIEARALPFVLAPLELRELEPRARLVGDVQSADFLLWLPPGSRPDALLIAYRSSIDVLPDESELSVFVNGTPLQPFRPVAFDQTAVVEFPADALQPGENVIRVEARHHHRIYCGADASFALWTEVDLLRSGARISGDALGLGGAGLRAALIAQAAEGRDLEVRSGPDVDPTAARLAFLAVAQATQGLVTRPRFESVWAPAPSDGSRVRITLLRGQADRVALARGGDGALVLLIVMASEDASWVAAEVDRLIEPNLTRAPLFALESQKETTLSRIGGAATFSLEGRYDTETFRFALPENWMAPPAGRAELELHYAFAPHYGAGSFMTVEINGKPIQSLPLDGKSPPSAPLAIRFDTAILRRGVNTLAFSVLSPGDPPDQPCPLGAPPPVTTISGETTITLPQGAPMRLAGMATSVLGVGGASLEFADAGRDDFARLAPFIALEPVLDAPEVRLSVVSIDDLPPSAVQELGISKAEIAETLMRGRAPKAGEAEPRAGIAGRTDWRGMLWALRDRLERLDARPVDTAPPLSHWLGELSARAVLLQPEAARPAKLLMVVDETTDAAAVAQSLRRARVSGRGPDGRVAVLTETGEWRSWFAASEPPELLEPLAPSNVANVLGTYASWAPEGFAIGGLGATWMSAAVAFVLIRLLRREDER